MLKRVCYSVAIGAAAVVGTSAACVYIARDSLNSARNNTNPKAHTLPNAIKKMKSVNRFVDKNPMVIPAAKMYTQFVGHKLDRMDGCGYKCNVSAKSFDRECVKTIEELDWFSPVELGDFSGIIRPLYKEMYWDFNVRRIGSVLNSMEWFVKTKQPTLAWLKSVESCRVQLCKTNLDMTWSAAVEKLDRSEMVDLREIVMCVRLAGCKLRHLRITAPNDSSKQFGEIVTTVDRLVSEYASQAGTNDSFSWLWECQGSKHPEVKREPDLYRALCSVADQCSAEHWPRLPDAKKHGIHPQLPITQEQARGVRYALLDARIEPDEVDLEKTWNRAVYFASE